MSSNNFYIYALLDTRKLGRYKYGKSVFTACPFYIGKGHGKRTKVSLKADAHNPFKARVIKKIKTAGKKPRVYFCRKNITERLAFKIEQCLIKKIGRRDQDEGPLTNLTGGGQGMSGYVKSNKTRLKISKKTKKQWKNKEFRLKMSKNAKKQWKNSEHKIKMSRLGSLRMKKLWKDTNFRVKTSKKWKNVWKNPELRAQKSERAKNLWKSTAFRVKWYKARWDNQHSFA